MRETFVDSGHVVGSRVLRLRSIEPASPAVRERPVLSLRARYAVVRRGAFRSSVIPCGRDDPREYDRRRVRDRD